MRSLVLRLRQGCDIGAVMHWHGLLTINFDYETNTKKANKGLENA